MRPTVRVSSETDWRSVPRLSPYGNWDSLQPHHSPDSDTQERTDELTPSFHKVFQTEQWSVQLHVWMLYTSEYSGWTFRYKLKTFSEKWSFRRVSNCQNSHRKQADETEWISQGDALWWLAVGMVSQTGYVVWEEEPFFCGDRSTSCCLTAFKDTVLCFSSFHTPS